MKRKYVPIRMRTEMFERVKKEALARGLSVSETIGTLLERSFKSEGENRSEISSSGPVIDSKMIRYQIETALKNIHGSAPGIDPKVIRYQVETLARIDSLLEKMALDRPSGEGKLGDWMKDANKKIKATVQDLRMDDGSAPMETPSPKKTFPKIGENQETEKSDLDFFKSLPQI